jgi:plastocyanin
MRKLLVTAVLTALAIPATAFGADHAVSMQGNRFTPSTLKIFTGDRVVWTNMDPTSHTVTSASFPSSGMLGAGGTHEVTFGSPRTTPHTYYCKVHPSMRGSVSVANVHLSGPSRTLVAGAAANFSGLARPGSAVTVHSADGSITVPADVRADGSFTARVPMARPGAYYASASGGLESARVKVSVRPRLALNSRRSGSRLVLSVAATPAQAGAPVVVQRRAGSRWVKIAGGRLNASSKATFRVARKTMKIRARTTRGVRGYTAATSRILGVR